MSTASQPDRNSASASDPATDDSNTESESTLDAETRELLRQPPNIDNSLYDRDPEELRSDRTLLPDMLNNPGNLRSDTIEEE
jgi:hypothetical protein